MSISQDILEDLKRQLQDALRRLQEYAAASSSPSKHPLNASQSDAAPQLPIPSQEGPFLWETAAEARHSVRVICDEEGLTVAQKNMLSQVVHCESNYNPGCVHPNVVNGKVTSTDFGIAQINDYYHIGKGKDFPSAQFVLDNPEACIRWMCKQMKAGHINLWVCASRNLYRAYAA